MNKILLSSIIILFIFSSCKTGKETNEPANRYEVSAVNPSAYETRTNPSTVTPVPPVPTVETITDDNPPPAQITLEPLDVPDSLLVSIERTPCFGSCPTYKLNIYNSGFAEYEGIRFVDSIGRFTGRVSQEKLKQVKELANQINYFELQDEYYNPYVADLPSTITIVQLGGRLKRILNGHEGTPQDLVIFEKFLDGIIQELGFHRWRTSEQED